MTETARGSIRAEFAWITLVVCAGIVPRIIVISLFPTEPVSDFRGLVDFAAALRDSGFAKGTWYWEFFNPGLPTLLSLVLRIVPGSPDVIARWTTAVLMGLVPLIPFVMWRGVFCLNTRILAGLLLALWPGQILFSGVVAQDNWVLMPTVALSALAVRSLILKDGGHPSWSALLFALGAFIRQEMLIPLLPVAIVSAGLGSGWKRPFRGLLIWSGLVIIFMAIIAGQRSAATGRFSLTTEHGGKSVLGAYVPGAGIDFWTDPTPYIATVDPSLLEDEKRLREESFGLALGEALRRPEFHATRIVSAVLNCLSRADVSNLYWSMGDPNVLDPEYHEKTAVFVKKASPLLIGWLLIINTAFLASFSLGLFKRNWPIIIVASALLLKIMVHAVLVTQPRFFIAVIALEILVIALGTDEMRKGNAKETYAFLIAGILISIFLFGIISPMAKTYVLTHDDAGQRVYRFSLAEPKGNGKLTCAVDRGRLSMLGKHSARIELMHADPYPGETARAECRLIGAGTSAVLALEVNDPYEPGGFPDRIAQRVIVEGKEMFYHDIASQPGKGWFSIPLGPAGHGTGKSVVIEIVSVRPDPGPAWGAAAKTEFRLALDGTP